MPTLEDAIILATNYHKEQVDKAGEPYILHPMRVMLSMETTGEKIVAILHDVLEDTDTTLSYLEEFFPGKLLVSVNALTHREGESYQHYLNRIPMYATAIRVKLADLRDNLSILSLPEIKDRDVRRIKKHYDAYKFLKGKL